MSKFQQSYLKPCDFQFTKSLNLNKFKTSQKHSQNNLLYLNNRSLFWYKKLKKFLGLSNFEVAKRCVNLLTWLVDFTLRSEEYTW